jgi:DNA-directed RNA polymerase specialized sigma24 family protein
MIIFSECSNATPSELSFEITWNELYPTLCLLTRRLVYSFHVQSWYGQEDEIVEDIMQETARRMIERTRKAEREEAPPVQVFERMAIVTAYNYCRDLRRRDCRLIRVQAENYPSEAFNLLHDRDNEDLSEEATECVYQEGLFRLLASEIAKFPDKQRKVLLIDLANRMSFETNPTPLQKAFLSVGIQLQEYKQPLPESTKERSRVAALLHYAYKRIAQIISIQQYATVA